MIASAQGVDVSNYQGSFRWSSTTGLSFGICRATQGLGGSGLNSPDPTLAWNWQQIAAKGLHRGAYHFFDPNQDGASQARYFVTTLQAHGLAATDMLWLDNETAGSSPSVVASRARAFMAGLDSLCPHNPRGVYTYISFAQAGNCAGLGGYPLWLAYPSSSAPAAPSPWSTWRFWQWGTTSQGGQTVDADAFNGTAAQLTQWIASYAPPPSAISKEDAMLTASRPDGGTDIYVLRPNGTAVHVQKNSTGATVRVEDPPGTWEALVAAGWRTVNGAEQAYLEGIGTDGNDYQDTWQAPETSWQGPSPLP